MTNPALFIETSFFNANEEPFIAPPGALLGLICPPSTAPTSTIERPLGLQLAQRKPPP